MEDFLLEIIDTKIAHFGSIHAKRRAIEKRCWNPVVTGNAGFGDVARAQYVGGADRAHGGPVIGVPARNDLSSIGLIALMDLVFASKFEAVLVCFRARTAERSGSQIARRQFCNFGRESDRDIGDMGKGASIV